MRDIEIPPRPRFVSVHEGSSEPFRRLHAALVNATAIERHSRLRSEIDGIIGLLSAEMIPEEDARRERHARLIDAQADRIELLERMLSPPGRRGLARLLRSPWWLRLARRLGMAG